MKIHRQTRYTNKFAFVVEVRKTRVLPLYMKLKRSSRSYMFAAAEARLRLFVCVKRRRHSECISRRMLKWKLAGRRPKSKARPCSE